MEKVFKLTPIDFSSEMWKYSSCKESVKISAESCGGARKKASDKYFIPPAVDITSKYDNTPIHKSPWEEEALVGCVQME